MIFALETIDLYKQFGGFIATNHIDLRVIHGARHAVIGPNGAGKTTLINLITGTLGPTSGRVLLQGNDITQLSPENRVARGMARTFQINQLFSSFTPREALALALCQRQNLGAKWFAPAISRKAIASEIDSLAVRFALTDTLDQQTNRLAYGKQRLLEIALAFAARPSLLLLDEPTAGVPEHERHELLAAIHALPKDVTVLLIEHDMDLVFQFADQISVLVNGSLFAQGSPQAIANDPKVHAVYLGEAGHD